MIRTLLQSICLGAFCLCIVAPAMAADAIKEATELSQKRIERRMKSFVPEKRKKYVTVESKDEPQEFAKPSKAYKVALQEAVLLHNLMNSIQSHKRRLEAYKLIVWDKELSEARVKDFDECNVKWLSTYFKEPKKVWEKLKDSADSRMTDYDLNMAVSAEQIAQEDVSVLAGIDVPLEDKANDTQTHEPFNVRNVMDDAPEVDIAFAVLNSFYPNQDEWGARKTSSTSSLPLWEDQKYLYDKDVWIPKYREINEFCEKQGHSLVLKEPEIKEEIKYDYHFYDQVKSAHNTFVKQALAQECLLTPQMKEAPKSAPRPLPPVREEIIVINDELGNVNSLYPQTPMNPSVREKGGFEKGTLWEAYKEDEFNHINENGEFNNYFNVSSNNTITTRPAVDSLDGKRITKHFLYKKENQNALDAYNSMLDDVANLKANVEEMAQVAKIDIPQDIDYMKEEDLKRLIDALKVGKGDYLKEAKAGIGNQNAALEDNKSKMRKRLAGSKYGFDDVSFNNSILQANSLIEMSQKDVSTLNEKDLSLAQAKLMFANSSLSIDENMKETEKDMRKNQDKLGNVLEARDEDWVYVNALEKDQDAELLITEQTAFRFDEALAEARANQELVNMLDKQTNESKLESLKDRNYSSDLNETCVGQTDNALVDFNTIQIK